MTRLIGKPLSSMAQFAKRMTKNPFAKRPVGMPPQVRPNRKPQSAFGQIRQTVSNIRNINRTGFGSKAVNGIGRIKRAPTGIKTPTPLRPKANPALKQNFANMTQQRRLKASFGRIKKRNAVGNAKAIGKRGVTYAKKNPAKAGVGALVVGAGATSAATRKRRQRQAAMMTSAPPVMPTTRAFMANASRSFALNKDQMYLAKGRNGYRRWRLKDGRGKTKGRLIRNRDFHRTGDAVNAKTGKLMKKGYVDSVAPKIASSVSKKKSAERVRAALEKDVNIVGSDANIAARKSMMRPLIPQERPAPKKAAKPIKPTAKPKIDAPTKSVPAAVSMKMPNMSTNAGVKSGVAAAAASDRKAARGAAVRGVETIKGAGEIAQDGARQTATVTTRAMGRGARVLRAAKNPKVALAVGLGAAAIAGAAYANKRYQMKRDVAPGRSFSVNADLYFGVDRRGAKRWLKRKGGMIDPRANRRWDNSYELSNSKKIKRVRGLSPQGREAMRDVELFLSGKAEPKRTSGSAVPSIIDELEKSGKQLSSQFDNMVTRHQQSTPKMGRGISNKAALGGLAVAGLGAYALRQRRNRMKKSGNKRAFAGMGMVQAPLPPRKVKVIRETKLPGAPQALPAPKMTPAAAPKSKFRLKMPKMPKIKMPKVKGKHALIGAAGAAVLGGGAAAMANRRNKQRAFSQDDFLDAIDARLDRRSFAMSGGAARVGREVTQEMIDAAARNANSTFDNVATPEQVKAAVSRLGSDIKKKEGNASMKRAAAIGGGIGIATGIQHNANRKEAEAKYRLKDSKKMLKAEQKESLKKSKKKERAFMLQDEIADMRAGY